MFTRRKEQAFTSEEMRKLGRLEAVVESLELKWTIYRDEMKKLVNRLERREERLEQKLRDVAAVGSDGDPAPSGPTAVLDNTTQRVLARRNKHVPG